MMLVLLSSNLTGAGQRHRVPNDLLEITQLVGSRAELGFPVGWLCIHPVTMHHAGTQWSDQQTHAEYVE